MSEKTASTHSDTSAAGEDEAASALVVDPIELAQELIRRPSVTPEEGGTLALLEEVLTQLGFECHRLTFSEAGTPDVENLYARLGSASPNICFAGHTDVVPAGERSEWTVDPFGGEIIDEWLYGRGAVDMKGAIACWVSAVSCVIADRGANLGGSMSLLITCDEEGPSINGTRKVVEWLKERGEQIDYCIVGEPTSRHIVCDTVKAGRRGSLNAALTIRGTQGHVAYPDQADNPVHRMVAAATRLVETSLDKGTEHFQPSSLQITSIDVENPTSNLIPARATARLNVRFNDLHTAAAVEAWIRERVAEVAKNFELEVLSSSEPFLTQPGQLTRTVSDAIVERLAWRPKFLTDGGTSDARFMKDLCPVIELGLRNATAHQVDERVILADMGHLTFIYEDILKRLLQAECSPS